MTTVKRSCLYGVLPLLLVTAVGAADAEAVYSHKVSPAKPTAESEYVSVKQDQTAKLLTVPENASFVANSGRVVELESKRHSDIIWMETKDTATEHEAKSPSIKAYRGTFAGCVGRFQTKTGGGKKDTPTEPEWSSKLKERCGHIIVAWYYPGDKNNFFLKSGETLREGYVEKGEPVVLVSIGAGGELKRLAQLVEHLRSQELTPEKSVSFDSIGHGGSFEFPDENGKKDSYRDITVVDDKKILDVIPQAVRDVLEDATATMSDDAFISPVVPELKCPKPIVSLYHCFSADKGIVGGEPAPSIAERIKALVPEMKVRGVKGLCTNPGPTGDLVEF